jgi:hypothetical protein
LIVDSMMMSEQLLYIILRHSLFARCTNRHEWLMKEWNW